MAKKKDKRKESQVAFFVNPLLRIGFFVILFFIFIGDIIRVIFRLIGNLFLKIGGKIKRLFKKKRIKIRKKRRAAGWKYFTAGVVFTLIIIFLYQGYQFIDYLPNPKLIGKINYPVSAQLFDRNGRLLYEIFREQNRTPIKLEELPDYVIEATIAIEDKYFYQHNGISIWGGILRAIKDMILTKKLQGGSTITQQLVKSALLTPERTIVRKIKEMILALWTEQVFTKNQILEMYVNQVSYGGSSYGIEEAAKTYFDKSAKDLNLWEAAFLAGLPQAPSLYSPYVNPQLAKQRQNEVLAEMLSQRYLSRQQYEEGLKFPLVVQQPKHSIKAPHFVFYVKSLLEEKYGVRQVEEGGFRVTTSLDLILQAEAEKILREELEKVNNLHVTNGGILITSPPRGEILAMVGSKNYFEDNSGAFNVTAALRQPGSAIKPLMYSLALDRDDYTPATIIDDSPVVFNSLWAQLYRPSNYDGRYHGRIPLRYALANSYNVPAVKVLNTLGVVNFINHAQQMGITTWEDPKRYGLSLTLGGGEVKMTDMAVAYGVFANQGQRVDLNPIIKIEDHLGNLIYSQGTIKKRRIIAEEIAFIISDILSDNFARRFAFGTRSSLDIAGYKVAVKTGTTNDKKDNWAIGYTPQYLVAVWVGNNDNSPMDPYLTSGVTGAAPIWNRTMTSLLRSRSSLTKGENEFKEPPNIVKRTCYFGRVEYFVKGTENKASCRELVFPSPTLPSSFHE